MISNDTPASSVASSHRRARRFRIIGVIVLALGIVGAGIVYWLGTCSPDLSGDLSMVGYDKPAERQMEILYGKQGEMIEDFANDLKRPGTQAVIIGVAATLVAIGCFYFARLSDDDDASR